MVHGSGLQARDVVAFGHEIGRALSDGRIVGRAEPFAKVFASSRTVKRAVGLVAWAILEDIALDAHLDHAGRLIATTNVRRIATNLAINKDTAAKHLARLRDYGFVIQEEGGQSPSGRWETCRYILDPSACLERFTHTPTPTSERQPVPPDGAEAAADPARPSPRDPDTVNTAAHPGADAVSETTGHGQPGHNNKKQAPVQEEQQQQPSTDAIASLVELGIDPTIAAQLTATHPAERIVAVAAAARARQVRNPAGWARTALEERWDLTIADQSGEPPPTAQQLPRDPDPPAGTPSAQRWATMLDAALDDRQLQQAIRLVGDGLPARAATSPRVVRARLLAWVQDLHRHDPHRPIEILVTRALHANDQHGDPQPGEDTPSAATTSDTARTALATRVRTLLQPHGTHPLLQATPSRGSPHAAEP
jgi:hypothetical protein